MTRHSRPLATLGVACLLSAASAVPADEPKAAPPRPVGVTIEVKAVDAANKGVMRREFTKTEVRVIENAAPPVAVPKGFVMPNIGVVAPNVNAAAVQHQTAAFRTILRAEYQIILSACEPTRDQRREIARAGERALATAAFQAALWQGTPRRRVVFKNGMNQVESIDQPDPRKVIRDALATAVKANLSAEQHARYLKEVESRAADEKQSVIHNLVERLDYALLLSADQRAKITDALAAKWDPAWCPSLQVLLTAETAYYFPQVPDSIIVPALTSAQARVWETLQKTPRPSWGGYEGVMGTDEQPLEDAGPADPASPAVSGPEAKP
jgi:hypothetical protein